MSAQLLLVELNEVNLEFVQAYIARGDLPNFTALLRKYALLRTTSEDRYEHVEPWIQWVTAHTGLSFDEHSVFRLGDIVSHEIPQIWEMLEDRGLKVGAISPMNAKHRLRNPAFFVPDPWTQTQITAPWTLRRLYAALSQAVKDNVTSKLSFSSVLSLLWGMVRYARPANYGKYLAYALRSAGAPWRKSMFLDLLLSDVFIRESRRTKPHFCTLFVNAAAHIQHHYMFSAQPYSGPHRNPDWYIPKGMDPVFEVYDLYDRIVGQIQSSFPNARLMIATGLHQVPHPELTYYWRLRDHEAFLRQVRIPFSRVEPLMSRDFLVKCHSDEEAKLAATMLGQAITSDGSPLFDVDNRGTDVFVMLIYAREITRQTRFAIAGVQYDNLFDNVAFVALKNGEHDGMGYLIDTGVPRADPPEQFPLSEIPQRIADALGQGALRPASR